jgi:branched-chain amino acid aminotransferase
VYPQAAAADQHSRTLAEDLATYPGYAYIDGEYVPLAEARIPILDRGFVRSDATYDVVHVWKGQFFRLSDHIDRFFVSMAGLRLDPRLTHVEIAAILEECVRRSGLRDAYAQMTCTRGVPPRGSRDPRLCVNRFYAFAGPFVWIANREQLERGLRLVVSRVERIPPESVDPRIKNFHWIDLTRGIFEACDRGGEVAVLVDRHGNITEGAGFNLFLVKGARLSTPEARVFEGMTRRTVFDICAEIDVPCVAETIHRSELQKADEVFLTSTAGGIMPVTSIDGNSVGTGKRGPITQRLHDLYWFKKESGWLSTPVNYGPS